MAVRQEEAREGDVFERISVGSENLSDAGGVGSRPRGDTMHTVDAKAE